MVIFCNYCFKLLNTANTDNGRAYILKKIRDFEIKFLSFYFYLLCFLMLINNLKFLN